MSIFRHAGAWESVVFQRGDARDGQGSGGLSGDSAADRRPRSQAAIRLDGLTGQRRGIGTKTLLPDKGIVDRCCPAAHSASAPRSPAARTVSLRLLLGARLRGDSATRAVVRHQQTVMLTHVLGVTDPSGEMFEPAAVAFLLNRGGATFTGFFRYATVCALVLY